ERPAQQGGLLRLRCGERAAAARPARRGRRLCRGRSRRPRGDRQAARRRGAPAQQPARQELTRPAAAMAYLALVIVGFLALVLLGRAFVNADPAVLARGLRWAAVAVTIVVL